MKKEQILRYPRPYSITQSLIQYHNSNDPKNKERILKSVKERIIRNYVIAGYHLNNQPISLEHLTQYLNIGMIEIIRTIRRVNESVGLMFNPDNNEKTVEMLKGIALRNSLEDRAKILKQYGMLESRQNGDFVAFLSHEVNNSLKLLLDSGKGITDLIKSLQPQGPNISISQSNNQALQVQNILTQEKAIELLSLHNSEYQLEPIQGTKALEELGTQYLTDDVPCVVATEQESELASRPSSKVKEAMRNKAKRPNQPTHDDKRGDFVDEVLDGQETYTQKDLTDPKIRKSMGFTN